MLFVVEQTWIFGLRAWCTIYQKVMCYKSVRCQMCNTAHIWRRWRGSADFSNDNRPAAHSTFSVFIIWAVAAARAMSCCLLTWTCWADETIYLRTENAVARPGTGARAKQRLMISMANVRLQVKGNGRTAFKHSSDVHISININSHTH